MDGVSQPRNTFSLFLALGGGRRTEESTEIGCKRSSFNKLDDRFLALEVGRRVLFKEPRDISRLVASLKTGIERIVDIYRGLLCADGRQNR